MRPQEAVEAALASTRSDRAVVLVQERSAANLRWAGNTLTTNGDTRSRGVTVVAIRDTTAGATTGVVTRGVADRDDLLDLVAEADAVADGAEVAQDEAPLVADRTSPDWGEPSPTTSAATFDGFAAGLAEAFGQARSGGRELFGFAEHDLTTTYVGTSAGTRLRHVQPNGKVELTGKAEQRSRSAWVGRYVPEFADSDIVDQAAEVDIRLDWQSRSLDVAPGRHDVVLTPSAVSDLLICLYWTAGARDAAEGRTVFSRPGGGTRVGDQVTDVPVRLWSDPAADGLVCAPFVVAPASTSVGSVFDNGMALSATDWIADGRLDALLQTRHSATLTGLRTTPAIDNLGLSVDGGQGGLSDVLAGVERGLLVSTLWYIREVDPQTLLLTGLTRDGVYVVEGGEVVGATTNFRFNESPVGLLSRITAAGEAETTLPREWSDYFTRVRMPVVRFAGFNMSTQSQAS